MENWEWIIMITFEMYNIDIVWLFILNSSIKAICWQQSAAYLIHAIGIRIILFTFTTLFFTFITLKQH